MSKTILVVDIETTGFLNQGGKIVEIGIVKLNLETGEIEKEYDSLIKEDGLSEKHTETPLGWIFKNSTLDYSELNNAPSLDSQRRTLQTLFDSYEAIAYNKTFDFGFLKDRGFTIDELSCPMMLLTPILKIDNGFGDENYKWPSVQEAWEYFFGDSGYNESHRALDDAIHEAQIVYELYKLGKIQVLDMSKRKISLDGLNFLRNMMGNVVESTYEKDYLQPILKAGYWGFCNKNLEVIIPCIYSTVNEFTYGLACVKYKGKYGYINLLGEVTIPFQYNYATKFDKGLAHVLTEKGGAYFIDISGNIKIDAQGMRCYDYSLNDGIIQISPPHEGYPAGYINENGDQIFELGELTQQFSCGRGVTESSHGYRVYNRFGKRIQLKNDYDWINPYSEYLALVCSNDKYGFIDVNGNEIVPLKFDEAHSFSEGLAAVCINKKWGFINNSGAICIPLKFDKANSFENGKSVVRIGNYYGMISKIGEELIPVKYDILNIHSDGFIASKLNGKWGVINIGSREIHPHEYDKIDNYYFNKIIVRKNWKAGLMDKFSVSPAVMYYDDIETYIKGLGRVKKDGKYGLLNQLGEEITPIKYDEIIGSDMYDLICVKIGDKFGLMDKAGNEITDIKYEWVSYYKSKFIPVKLNDKWGFVDYGGKEITSIKYDEESYFHNGIAYVKLNGVTVSIDEQGNES